MAQKGLQALAGLVPFGPALYAIGAAACEMVKKAEQREEDRRILLQEMLQASDQQIRQAAEDAAQQAAAGLSAEAGWRSTRCRSASSPANRCAAPMIPPAPRSPSAAP